MSEPYRIVTLYSGSGGNATYVEAAGVAILIDAGKSARALCRALSEIGSAPERLSAIFITHEHRDHVAALEVFCKKYPVPVHIMEESATYFDRLPRTVVQDRLVHHSGMFCEQVGGLRVQSFRTSHDSRMSVGYRMVFEEGGVPHALGLATDTGYVPDSVREGLLGCEAVVLESNHDLRMLMEGPYPYDLKKRIASRRGHLSNDDSAALMAELAAGGTRHFLLAHLSEENNLPELAYHTAENMLDGMDVSVCVAAPDAPTPMRFEKSSESEEWTPDDFGKADCGGQSEGAVSAGRSSGI